MIELYPVISTAMKRAGYDVDSQVLRVEFPSGRICDYSKVTPAWFDAFCKAPSKGRFLAGILKDPGGHPWRRVTHNFGRKHTEDLCIDCGISHEKSINIDESPCQEWKVPAF